MAIIPRRLTDKIAFFRTHLPSFAANATAIGVSVEEVDDLQAKTDAATAAYREQQQALAAAQAATATFNMTVEAMNTAGASLVAKIRATARAAGDDHIFVLASLPVPAGGSPVAAPGTPSQLFTELGGLGALHLSWTCDNPVGSMGTVYAIHRRVGDDGPSVFLGMTGEKRFTDGTIPKGATRLIYKIQAMRSTKAGEPAEFPVSFGSNGQAMPPMWNHPRKLRIAA